MHVQPIAVGGFVWRIRSTSWYSLLLMIVLEIEDYCTLVQCDTSSGAECLKDRGQIYSSTVLVLY